MESLQSMNKYAPTGSAKHTNQVNKLSSSVASGEKINLTLDAAKKEKEEQHIVKEKIETDLQEMEHLAGLDQVLEARSVVDRIHETLKKSSISHNDYGIISQERQEVMNNIINESNHANEMLHDMDSDDGWTLATNKQNVIVHYRNDPGSPIQIVKTETIFENCTTQDFVRLCAIFAEVEYMPEVFPKKIIKDVEILAEPSKHSKVCRFVMSFGNLPISPRDGVMFGRGFHLPSRNAALIISNSIDDCKYCNVPPTPEGYVRIDSKIASYIQLLPNSRILLRQISHSDMKLKHVPPMMINHYAKGGMPHQVVKIIRKHMDNFEDSVWDKRMKERKEYYQEIADQLGAGKEEVLIVKEDKKMAEIQDGKDLLMVPPLEKRTLRSTSKSPTTASQMTRGRQQVNNQPYKSIKMESNEILQIFAVTFPVIDVACAVWFFFQMIIMNQLLWQRNAFIEITSSKCFVLSFLFLTGFAIPAMMKTALMNYILSYDGQIKTLPISVTNNSIARTTLGSHETLSTSVSENVESVEASVGGDKHIVSQKRLLMEGSRTKRFANSIAEDSDEVVKQNHLDTKEKKQKKSAASNMRRLVRRAFPIHKIKSNFSKNSKRQKLEA